MLLKKDDPAPCICGRGLGAASFVLSCEHAGTAVPHVLGDLGLAQEDLRDHIGWDPGALWLTEALSERLGASFVAQAYSRLVIDCNRPQLAPDLAAVWADDRPVPGNCDLSQDAIEARWREIHQPFHAGLAAHLPGCKGLLSIHSFTAKRRGDAAQREVEIGILARDGNPLFQHLIQTLPALHSGQVLANAPYAIDDESDYTIPVHAEPRGLPHALIEVRSDLLQNAASVARIADIFAHAIRDFPQ